jgi:transcriptional regulator with XRE-family HTH domain
MQMVRFKRTGVWREVERRRWEYGETQKQFAQRIGISQAQYSQITLRRQVPATQTLAAFIREFPDLRDEFLMEAGLLDAPEKKEE